MKSGIYWIVSPSGRCYIGSSRHVEKRLHTHKSLLRRGAHTNAALQNAARKYGLDALHFGLVELCDVAALIEREQFYMDALGFEMLYNIRPRAESNAGHKATPETRVRLSERVRREWANGTRSRSKSDETRARMSESAKARSAQSRIAQINAVSGRKLSDEHRAAISAGNMGRNVKPTTRRAIGARVSAALNTSGYKGVSYVKGRDKWCAYAQLGGKTKRFGNFATRELAYTWRLVMLAHLEYA